MTINTHVADPATGVKAVIGHPVEAKFPQEGLIVYTPFVEQHATSNRAFADDQGNIQMNIDALPAGPITNVYDGGDNAGWTPSGSSPRWVLASALQNNTPAGAFSLHSNNARTGEFVSLTETDTDLAPFLGIKGFFYIEQIDSLTRLNLQAALNTVNVGSPVDIRNFINLSIIGSWQPFFIPLSDMGLAGATIDEFIITATTSTNSTNKYFIDDFGLQEPGVSNPVTYTLRPNIETLMDIQEFSFYLEGPETEGQGATGISGTGMLSAVGLTLGFTFRIKSLAGIVFSTSVVNMRDLLRLPGTRVQTGGDAINMWASIQLDFRQSPLYISSNEKEFIEIVVQDDYSLLTNFTVTSQFKSRPLEPGIT